MKLTPTGSHQIARSGPLWFLLPYVCGIVIGGALALVLFSCAAMKVLDEWVPGSYTVTVTQDAGEICVSKGFLRLCYDIDTGELTTVPECKEVGE